MKKMWWKILAVIVISGTIIGGLLGPVPVLPILNETIRNVYFHVPMWFTMVFLYLLSVIYSIKYLNSGQRKHDLMAVETVNGGVLYRWSIRIKILQLLPWWRLKMRSLIIHFSVLSFFSFSFCSSFICCDLFICVFFCILL